MAKVDTQAFCEDEMKEIGVQLVGSWFVTAMQAFVDAAGSEEVLNSLRTYMRFNGNAGGLIWQKKLGLTGTDATAIATVMQHANLVMRRLTIRSFRASEGRAMGDIVSCAFENALPEVCEATCHLAGRGLCESFNTEYDFDLPYARGKGDPFCRYVVRKKSDRYDSDFENDESMKTLPLPTATKDEMYFWGSAVSGEWWTLTTNGFVDFAGLDRTMEILGPYMKQNGISFGLKYARELNIKEKNAAAIDSILTFMNSCLGQNGSASQLSEGRIEREINECPFSGAPAELCRQLEAFTNGVCEAVNPDYELVHSKAMCRGDPTCVRIVRRKGAVKPAYEATIDSQKEPMKSPEDDPLKILKIRFAKGEISKSEYADMRDLLSE